MTELSGRTNLDGHFYISYTATKGGSQFYSLNDENEEPDWIFSFYLLVFFCLYIYIYIFFFSRKHKHYHRLDNKIECHLWLPYKCPSKVVCKLTSVKLSRNFRLGAHLCTLIIAGSNMNMIVLPI